MAAVPLFLVWAQEFGYRGNDIHLVRSPTAKVKSEKLEQYLWRSAALSDGADAQTRRGRFRAVLRQPRSMAPCRR
jgi:hypothetical protein